MTVESTEIRPVDVLLVEDNPADVELTQRILGGSEHPVNVTVAEDGEVAMSMLRKVGDHSDTPTPDLILLDLNMPKMNGYEVLAAMSQSESLNRIPVLILTSTQAERDRLQFANVSPSRYCNKPLPIHRFNDIMGWLRSEEYVDWFAVGALNDQEKVQAMLEKYSEIAALPDGERNDRVSTLLRAEHDMLDDRLRAMMKSRLQALLQMDEPAAGSIAAAVASGAQRLPSEQAMLHVAIAQRLRTDLPEEDQSRLLALDPALVGERRQPTRAPRQEVEQAAPRRRWWWPFGG